MTEASGGRRAQRALASVRRRTQPVDVVVAVAVLATFAGWVWLTRDLYYLVDDWVLIRRGQTPGDLLRSYNGHLSVTYLLVYRVHVGLFGVDRYWILQVLNLTALVATPVLTYLTLRRRAGVTWAAVAALALLWPHGVSIEAAAMNHWAGLALGVVVAWALEERGRRGHLVVGGCLALGFLTVGGTVAVAVAALTSCVLSRAPLGRWVAVVVPCLVWYGWYRWEIGSIDIPEQYQLSTGETIRLVVDGQAAALRTLTMDVPVLAVGLGFVMVGLAAWRLWVDRWRGATVLGTWAAANVAWWVGLATSRGVLADPEVFRYRYVGAVLLVLALVPPPRTGAAAAERASRAPWAGAPARHPLPAALAVLTVGVVLVAGNLRANRDEIELFADFGRATRVMSAAGFATPSVVPPDATFGPNMGWSSGADLAELRDRYGPRYDLRSELDAELIDRGAVVVVGTRDAPPDPCTTTGPVEVPSERVVVEAGDRPTTVSVRRFGPDPIEVLDVPAGRAVTLVLRGGDHAPERWVVTAEGACVTPR